MTTRRKSYEMNIPAHDLRRFDWDRESNLLVAEASDLECFAIRRLYNDACDMGIAILSPTGTEKRFNLVDTDVDGEGDVQGWRFNPVDGIGPSVLVIND